MNAQVRSIRDRIIAYHLAAKPNPGVLKAARTLQKADGSYSDINYETPQLSFPAVVQLYRLAELVLAYASDASALRGDKEVCRQIHVGLGFWFKTRPKTHHEWYMQIGAPLEWERILLPFHEQLTPDELRQGVALMRDSYHDGVFHFGGGVATGQNMLWVARVVLASACLTEELDLIERAVSEIRDVIKITPEEGIQIDFTFHQHGPNLYSGGYGQGFAHDALLVASFLRGLPFALPEEKIIILGGYILDGQQWMNCGPSWDFNTIGREISRPGQGTKSLALATNELHDLQPARAHEALAMSKRLSGLTPPLEGAPLGHRHFWRSDYTAHMGPGWRIGLKMFSTRTIGTESGNNEGLRNYHLPEGSLCLMRTGEEYRKIFPLWNWRQIPGTTAVQDTGPLPLNDWGHGSRGETSFVGGVSNGKEGASAFDFKRNGLFARKAWFFLSDQIVCLGAAITTEASAPVTTCVEQNRSQDPMVMVEEGVRLLHGKTGYWFAPGQKVMAGVEKRTASWHDINLDIPASKVESEEVFTCTLDHGVKPREAEYVYAILPDSTEASLKAYAAPQIAANQASLQAIWSEDRQLGAAVFYAPGTVTFPGIGPVKVDQPCILLISQKEKGCELAVADPTQTQTHLTVEMPKVVPTPIRVNLPVGEKAGSSVQLPVTT